jgi:hypothetical protein
MAFFKLQPDIFLERLGMTSVRIGGNSFQIWTGYLSCISLHQTVCCISAAEYFLTSINEQGNAVRNPFGTYVEGWVLLQTFITYRNYTIKTFEKLSDWRNNISGRSEGGYEPYH